MKPRVAHVINSFGLGGVPQVAYQLLKSLPTDTYDLYLYVLKSYEDNADARMQLKEKFNQLGVAIRCPDRDDKKFYVVSQIARWLIEDEIDILHTHSYKPNIYGRLAGSLCKSSDIKLVAHYHNVYDSKWAADDSLIYEQRLAEITDKFLACSTLIARKNEHAIGLPEGRIEILLNGIDLDKFSIIPDAASTKVHLGLPNDCTLVGTVGRISKQKAQDVFIQAAAKVIATYPNTLFLIVGAEEEPGQIEGLTTLAASLGVADKIRFLGHVQEMPTLYGILDVLAMPSRWEGLPLTLVEAMAVGLPVVCTDVGGISEVVKPNESALIVEQDNPVQLADAINKLFANPDMAKALSKAGKQRAQAFSHKSIGQQAHRFYQAMLIG